MLCRLELHCHCCRLYSKCVTCCSKIPLLIAVFAWHQIHDVRQVLIRMCGHQLPGVFQRLTVSAAMTTAFAHAAGMRRAGVQPNTVSYNSLLSVCERCGQAERALEVFTTMEREAGPTIGYTGSSIVTYNTLISACGKAGMYDQVQRIHAEMLAKGIRGDVFTMCGLITACERVRHAAQAYTMLHHARFLCVAGYKSYLPASSLSPSAICCWQRTRVWCPQASTHAPNVTAPYC